MYIYKYLYISPNKRSFRGPGGVGRGLDSLRGPKSVHRNWPLWSPAWPPDYFSVGGSPESCAPPTLPAWSPAWSPWPSWSPWSPVAPLVPRVALERPPIILVRRPMYGPISCARLLPPIAPQICCAKIAVDPSARFAECPPKTNRRSDAWADSLHAAIIPRCPASLHEVVINISFRSMRYVR